MKFFTDNEEVATVRADQAAARKCYNASLEVAKKRKKSKEEDWPLSSSNVMLIDLNARGWKEAKRPEPDGELEVVQIELEDDQTNWVNKNLPFPLNEKLVAFLRRNMDLFAWTTADMLGINLEFMNHRLAIFLDVWPVV